MRKEKVSQSLSKTGKNPLGINPNHRVWGDSIWSQDHSSTQEMNRAWVLSSSELCRCWAFTLVPRRACPSSSSQIQVANLYACFPDHHSKNCSLRTEKKNQNKRKQDNNNKNQLAQTLGSSLYLFWGIPPQPLFLCLFYNLFDFLLWLLCSSLRLSFKKQAWVWSRYLNYRIRSWSPHSVASGQKKQLSPRVSLDFFPFPVEPSRLSLNWEEWGKGNKEFRAFWAATPVVSGCPDFSLPRTARAKVHNQYGNIGVALNHVYHAATVHLSPRYQLQAATFLIWSLTSLGSFYNICLV